MASSFNRFEMLRANIELVTSCPALIMVTSARAHDGSSLAAVGLADCLAAAGHRVALVARDIENAVPAKVEQPPRFSLHRLAEKFPTDRRPSDAIANGISAMRAAHDFTIIDAPPLLESSVSMLLAGSADVVLLAMQLGRLRCAEDQLMMKALTLSKARVLGVIGATEASIREFEHAERTSGSDERVKRSKATGKPASSIVTAP